MSEDNVHELYPGISIPVLLDDATLERKCAALVRAFEKMQIPMLIMAIRTDYPIYWVSADANNNLLLTKGGLEVIQNELGSDIAIEIDLEEPDDQSH